MPRLHIANTVADLILGDVREHLPLERIPLQGDVLGLGTTTSLDNGELAFLHEHGARVTRLYKCQASDGGVRELRSGDGSGHFPYVCFTDDMSGAGTDLPLDALGETAGASLQELVRRAIERLRAADPAVAVAPVYGVRLTAEWESLVITVASKLCMGQERRNRGTRVDRAAAAAEGGNLYTRLPHYLLAAAAPHSPGPIRYLGASRHWDCCGFYDTDPCLGRLTLPQDGAHLHLHGLSTDLRHGGHLHHEHPQTRLKRLLWLRLCPLRELHALCSDLQVDRLAYDAGQFSFRLCNCGGLDVSDVGVAVVIDDRYSSHRYLRVPWLAADEEEFFRFPLSMEPGTHRIRVIADPEAAVLEARGLRGNNTGALTVGV